MEGSCVKREDGHAVSDRNAKGKVTAEGRVKIMHESRSKKSATGVSFQEKDTRNTTASKRWWQW